MALLSLLLAGNEAAWRIPELHPLREKHGFVGKARLLELHFHMVGKESIESAVFTEYLDVVHARHPEAPVPPLFGDDKLFQMAAQLLGELGEERFFPPMNQGELGDARWGKAARGWTRDRFESAAASADPKVRAELFSALVKKRFPGWEQERRAFVDFDSGLAALPDVAGRAKAGRLDPHRVRPGHPPVGRVAELGRRRRAVLPRGPVLVLAAPARCWTTCAASCAAVWIGWAREGDRSAPRSRRPARRGQGLPRLRRARRLRSGRAG